MIPIRTLLAAVLLGVLAFAALSLVGCTPKVQVAIGAYDETILREVTVARDPKGDRHHPQARIAQIDIRGVIMDGRTPGLLVPGPNPVDAISRRLEMAANDSRVKAVLLRINSPGGTVAASEAMYAEVMRFREKTGKPVIVSMGETAASGGYYIALAADRVVAQETTITGSIGVIFPTINVSSGLARIGVVSRAVKSGPNKDLVNPLEPMRDEQYQVVQSVVDDFYGRFVTLVQHHRTQLKTEDVPTATDGRIMTGAQALELGLVDELGTLRDAYEAAKHAANLTGATWIKYQSEDAPRASPYAIGPDTPVAGAIATAPTAAVDRVMAAAGVIPSGFYYLWLPGAAGAQSP
jgi:protease-4